jgi:phosphoglycolate phosphatase-like HAD superfamily hydrolase
MKQLNETIPDISTYKALILDLDGTLVELHVDWPVLKNALSAVCKEESGEEIEFRPLIKKLSEVKRKYGEAVYNKLVAVVTKYESNTENYTFNTELIDYINSSDQPYVIYSMNTEPTVKSFVNNYLKRKPVLIISAQNSIEPKPSGKDLEKIIDELKFSKKDVLFIGNTNYDAESGNAVQIKTIIISIE